jgi:hypothetical protein
VAKVGRIIIDENQMCPAFKSPWPHSILFLSAMALKVTGLRPFSRIQRMKYNWKISKSIIIGYGGNLVRYLAFCKTDKPSVEHWERFRET